MTDHHEDPIAALRAEIDRLDDTILDLIEQRLAAAAGLATLKRDASSTQLKYRPRREANVLARLAARTRTASPQLIERVWRELMGHGLQAQARTELILAGSDERDVLEAHVRAHFGSAAPLSWASSAAEALERAEKEEAVAVIAGKLPPLPEALAIGDVVAAPDGTIVAQIVGRVAEADRAPGCNSTPTAEPAEPVRMAGPSRVEGWTPGSWRARQAAQMPVYPDAAALSRVETRLAASAPLVDVADIILLKASLARVAAGESFLLQGGDCAESFAEFGADKVRMTYNLLLQMGAMVRAAGGPEVVHLARIAGQFAKPRSAGTETIDGVTLPSYRGDAVNGPAFTQASRTPDPRRLLDAHRQAQVTIELLQAYAAASYADLPEIHRSVGSSEPVRPVAMYTSHEALLLNYEQALARYDEASDSWWATSGHMIWIGDRTRSPDGAHVEFARGVANPVGLKCGPSMDIDDLLRLMERIDPDNRPGRLVLIGRFGADKVSEHLPALMRATKAEGRNAIWSIDPMHGNTRSAGRLKTRLVSDIVAEVQTFFEVARAEGVHAGGVHLEMTGAEVTECLGGSLPLVEEDLPRRYLTHCDPRLNQQQALDVAAAVSRLLAAGSGQASDAA
jgi:3-deoxy-7-phosphoheptulonate synthase